MVKMMHEHPSDSVCVHHSESHFSSPMNCGEDKALHTWQKSERSRQCDHLASSFPFPSFSC